MVKLLLALKSCSWFPDTGIGVQLRLQGTVVLSAQRACLPAQYAIKQAKVLAVVMTAKANPFMLDIWSSFLYGCMVQWAKKRPAQRQQQGQVTIHNYGSST